MCAGARGPRWRVGCLGGGSDAGNSLGRSYRLLLRSLLAVWTRAGLGFRGLIAFRAGVFTGELRTPAVAIKAACSSVPAFAGAVAPAAESCDAFVHFYKELSKAKTAARHFRSLPFCHMPSTFWTLARSLHPLFAIQSLAPSHPQSGKQQNGNSLPSVGFPYLSTSGSI